jgi:hypothetical protein
MPIVHVSDTNDSALRMYSHQRDALLLDWPGTPHGLFVSESVNVCSRAMDAGLLPLSFLLEEKWLDRTLPLIERAWALDPTIPAHVATHQQYQAITSFEVTRGALAAFERPALPEVSQLLAGARRVAVLEDVTNYANVGAIFRSAAALGVDAHLGRLGVEPGRFHDPLLVHLFNEEVPAFPEGGVRCQAADEAQEEIRGGFLEFDRRGHEVEAVGAPVDGIDTFPVFLAVAEGDALGADAGGGVLALAGSSGLCGGFCLFTGSALHAHGQETSEASSEGEGHAVGGVIIFDALVITAGEEDGSPALDDGLIAVEEGIAVIGGHGDLHTDID